jgi:uncharacterized OsmC-like protein
MATLNVNAKMREGFKTEIFCGHNFVLDQPKEAGGTDEGPNPLDTYLASICGCICAIGRIIAKQRKIELRGIEVRLSADIDKAFLLGKTQEGRAGFTNIITEVLVDAPELTASQKEEFIAEVERRCPIADNTKNISTLKTKVIG